MIAILSVFVYASDLPYSTQQETPPQSQASSAIHCLHLNLQFLLLYSAGVLDEDELHF